MLLYIAKSLSVSKEILVYKNKDSENSGIASMYKEMKVAISSLLIVFLGISNSFAYIPPSYFVAKKITERKKSWERVFLRFSLFKIGKGKKELLWSGNLVYPLKLREEKKERKEEEYWPLLELLLEKDSTNLIQSWKDFQLNVSKEEELLLFKEEDLKKLGEIPSPFYKMEENSIYRRLKNRTVWSYESMDESKALIIEKDSFLPLMFLGLCPQEVSKIQGQLFSKKMEMACFLRFSYAPKWSRLLLPNKSVLHIDGRAILLFQVDALVPNPKQALIDKYKKTSLESAPDVPELVEIFYEYFLKR